MSSISSTYIVEILLKENLINYKTNKNYYLIKKKIKNILKKIISLKKKIVDFLLFIKIKNLLSKNITNINSDDLSNIGIYYAEGLIESKKSDLFWFDKDLFIAKNVIIYVDDLSLLNKHQHYLKNLEYINKNNFKLIYIKPYLETNQSLKIKAIIYKMLTNGY